MNIINYVSIPNGGCKQLQLFIVGPYPKESYIKTVYGGLSKVRIKFEIIVYADDSWNIDEIEEIEKIPDTKVILVKSGKGEGLVHAKMYFLKAQNAQGESSYTLITGSANATISGMSHNAEVMTVTELTEFDDSSQDEIKKYFESFAKDEIRKVDAVKALFKNSNKSFVKLPALEKANRGEMSFYSWLKSGYLFNEYDKDPNFGYIVIRLGKTLSDEKNKLNKLIKEAGFVTNESAFSVLKYPYLNLKTKVRISLKKYALQSDYGCWISKECFKEKKELFQKRVSSDIRRCIKGKQVDDEIKKNIQSSLEKLLVNESIRKCIEKDGISDKIGTIVNRKLKKDLALSQNKDFVFRYTMGIVLHKMPNFDEDDFDDFLNSAMASCLIKLKESRIDNSFVMKLRDIIPEGKKFKDASSLSKWLNDNWSDYYDQLRNYYKDKNESENEDNIKINLIQQKYGTDSGIACVAMLSGKDYESVMKKAKKCKFSRKWGNRRDRNYGMNNEQIKILIQKFISQFNIKRRFRTFEKWDDIKSRCLVSVDFNKENKTCHWVIADRVDDDLIIYDPKENEPIKNPEKRYQKNIYQYLPISF